MRVIEFNHFEYLGQKVRIYRNLHNKKLSVQTKVKGVWKVIGHTDNIALINATFKVSEAGRQRTITRRRKTVHAFVEGVIAFPNFETNTVSKITYNPYKNSSFINTETFEPIEQAKMVIVQNTHGILAYN